MSEGTPWPGLARRLQGASNGLDEQLTAKARLRRPRVKHWWGRRTWYENPENGFASPPGTPQPGPGAPGQRTGAWCYVCNTPIVTWSSRWPVPEIAVAAIAAHRTEHLQGTLDVPAPETEEHP